MIGNIISILFLLFCYRVIELHKKTSKGIIFALVLFTFSLAFIVKGDSTLGRILIYKVSLEMFLNNIWNGVGIGNFQIKYGLYQAKYFEKGFFTTKEFLLADNVFFAFNDYWQFIIETGLIGGLILTAFLFLISKLIIIELKANRHTSRLLISILLMFTSAAFFTHVFEKPLFQFIMISILAWLVSINRAVNFGGKYRVLLFAFPSVICAVILLINYFVNFNDNLKLEKAQQLSLAGYHLESKMICQKLYNLKKK